LNAEMGQTVEEMNAFKSQIRHLVKLYFADNHYTLAAHAEKAPAKKKLPTP